MSAGTDSEIDLAEAGIALCRNRSRKALFHSSLRGMARVPGRELAKMVPPLNILGLRSLHSAPPESYCCWFLRFGRLHAPRAVWFVPNLGWPERASLPFPTRPFSLSDFFLQLSRYSWRSQPVAFRAPTGSAVESCTGLRAKRARAHQGVSYALSDFEDGCYRCDAVRWDARSRQCGERGPDGHWGRHLPGRQCGSAVPDLQPDHRDGGRHGV